MIALHIEDNIIRLMLFEGRQVLKVASSPLEPGLVENGEVKDKPAVSQRISELLASQNIADKQVIAGVTGVHSIYHIVSLPHMARNMVAEAAQRELGRVMAVPLAELYTSWQSVDISQDEIVICLAGLPRNTVDAMLETLKMAGLHSVGLDVAPLALARLADEEDAVMVNVQNSSFDIVIMAKGIPELLRSLTFPSENVAAQDKVALIKEELGRTVAFYNSSHQVAPLTKDVATFISGELHDALAASLDYRVKSPADILSSQADFSRHEYAVNIGLALKQAKDLNIPLRVSIDATPGANLPKPRPVAEVISWVALALAVVLLVAGVLITQNAVADTSALSGKVTALELQVGQKQAANALLKMSQSTVEAVKGAQQATKLSLDSFKAKIARVNGDLAAITRPLPGTVNLMTISYSDKVTLGGSAPDKEAILSYSRALRDTGRFAKVTISDMHEVDYAKWAFSFKLE
jgi:type IV pilus assembly protein PilM